MISTMLMRKTLRDYLPLWSAVLVLLMAFVVLFMVATNSQGMANQVEDTLRSMPFVRRLMTVMIGQDPLDILSPTSVTAFVFTHPLVWVLLIAFALIVTSGVLAGEVDRGTMDLLATMPLSRASIYASLSLTVLLMGLPLCWGIWGAVGIGRWLMGVHEVRMDALVRVTWHLYAVYVLIATFSLAISGWSNRRGLAAAVAFFLVFYAFVLNLLRALWPALERLAWSDFLNYYQTLRIVMDRSYRWGDFAVLGAVTAVWWVAGLVFFRRRDIPAR